jgi:HTH-type transcriptional regulator/antitoxin HigA
MSRAGLTTISLAAKLNVTTSETTSLLAGMSDLSRLIAEKLSSILGGSTEYWMKREAQFRADLAKIPIERRYDADWLNAMPYADLVRLGWLKNRVGDNERAEEVLNFFGIFLSAQWRLRYTPAVVGKAFRTSPSFDTHHEAVTAWLRQGERIGVAIECRNWNPIKFRERLIEVRKLTKNKFPTTFIPELRMICADCGVALVIARTPSGCHASGATQFLSKNKALLMLSFRFKTDDQFWFSFFHEAGHLLVHDIDEIFIDEQIGRHTDSKEEDEANQFAADLLVTKENRAEMLTLPLRAADVIRFAVKNGVSPGIVVGQMQYAGVLEYNHLHKLKRRYSEADIDKVASL